MDQDMVPLLPKPRTFNRANIIFASATILFLSAIAAIIAYYAIKMTHNTHTDKIEPALQGTLSLCLQDLATHWETSRVWKLVAYFYGQENIQITDLNTMQVKYPAGSFQNAGGFKFYSQPYGFPTNTACLTYSILFLNNFQWVKGGKLPGLWIGDIGANGGNHIDNGFSARFMWRSGGDAEVYLYLPNNQKNEYHQQIISNNDYGDYLWRSVFKFQQSQWNNISLCITLNTPQSYDGVLEAQINNITMNITNLMWTPNPTLKINGIMMNTFYGGNDPTWAPKDTMYSYFKNFTIKTT